MPDKDALDFSAPQPKPVIWPLVMMPLLLAAGPIVLAFLGFSLGYVGMVIAAPALLLGFLLSPIAAILAIINSFRYWRNSRVLALNALAILVAGAALLFELWRMNRPWD